MVSIEYLLPTESEFNFIQYTVYNYIFVSYQTESKSKIKGKYNLLNVLQSSYPVCLASILHIQRAG